MINLKIDPEFQSQIPPLTDDEFKQLEENILKEGKLLSPLIVWNNILVDGHNRYAILQKHPEIYFSTMPLRFANREEALAWICKNQLGRRNLTPEQKYYLMGKQYAAEKAAHGGDRKSSDAKIKFAKCELDRQHQNLRPNRSRKRSEQGHHYPRLEVYERRGDRRRTDAGAKAEHPVRTDESVQSGYAPPCQGGLQ